MELKTIYGTLIIAVDGAKTVLELLKAAIDAKKSLQRAYLQRAYLRGAYLRGADLRGADNIPSLVLAQLQFIPETGAFEGWKKCQNNVIVRLLVPSDAKRSHGSERKCRATHVEVLEVVGGELGISLHDGITEYVVGKTVRADGWTEDRWETCGQGIHFYLTRIEAENHQ